MAYFFQDIFYFFPLLYFLNDFLKMKVLPGTKKVKQVNIAAGLQDISKLINNRIFLFRKKNIHYLFFVETPGRQNPKRTTSANKNKNPIRREKSR